MSEFGYIPEAPEQSFGNNKGIFNPKDIYDLTRADKYTNYGQLELIETQTISSGVTFVHFIDIKEDIYNVHFLTYNNITFAPSSSSYIGYQLTEGGTLETGNVYQYAYQFNSVNGGAGEVKSTGDNNMNIGIGTSQSVVFGGYSYLYNLGDSSKYSFGTGMTNVSVTSGTPFTSFYSSVLPQASQVTQIRFMNDLAQNFTAGSISLYGIKEYS